MTFRKPLVLLVDDDAPLRKYLGTLLAGAGYEVLAVESGEQALKEIEMHTAAAVVLDLGLPDIDGQQLLVKLREKWETPIVVLSARDDPAEKIAAIDHGADDYLTKPFSSGELLARIRLALRHHAKASSVDQSPILDFGGLRVDLFAHRVFVREREVHLTPIEFKVLALFARHAGKILRHRFLLSEIWGPAAPQQPQNVRVLIAGLRRKIESDSARPRHLLTEQGIGYRLMPCEAEPPQNSDRPSTAH